MARCGSSQILGTGACGLVSLLLHRVKLVLVIGQDTRGCNGSRTLRCNLKPLQALSSQERGWRGSHHPGLWPHPSPRSVPWETVSQSWLEVRLQEPLYLLPLNSLEGPSLRVGLKSSFCENTDSYVLESWTIAFGGGGGGWTARDWTQGECSQESCVFFQSHSFEENEV